MLPQLKLDKPDFQSLWDSLLGVSKKLLAKQGGFLPHAAAVYPDGKETLIGALTDKEQPGAQRVLELLEPSLRSMATQGKYRAIGLAIDTRLKSPPRKEDVGKDAIWIFLEHKDGSCLSVFTPYSKSWLGGLKYAESFTMPATPRFFTGR